MDLKQERLVLQQDYETAVKLIDLLEPLWNLELKKVSVDDDEILQSFDGLLGQNKSFFDYLIRTRETKLIIAKYIASVDNTVHLGDFSTTYKMGGTDELVPYEVSRKKKSVYFNKNFCLSILAILLGIMSLYLSVDILNVINEKYTLNITLSGLLTNFKSSIENIPVAIVKTVSVEALEEIKYRVQKGCMASSGNTISTLINSLISTADTSECVMRQTSQAIANVTDLTVDEIKTQIMICHNTARLGITFIIGGGANALRQIRADENEQKLLAIEYKDQYNMPEATIGGKKKSRRNRRKTKKGKKGKKGRKSHRKH